MGWRPPPEGGGAAAVVIGTLIRQKGGASKTRPEKKSLTLGFAPHYGLLCTVAPTAEGSLILAALTAYPAGAPCQEVVAGPRHLISTAGSRLLDEASQGVFFWRGVSVFSGPSPFSPLLAADLLDQVVLLRR